MKGALFGIGHAGTTTSKSAASRGHDVVGVVAGGAHEARGTTRGLQSESLRETVTLGGVSVDLMSAADAIDFIVARALRGSTKPLGVLSANLDHVHHFGSGGRWHGVLENAEEFGAIEWLSLVDGAPLVAQAHRLTRQHWPRLAGSDLIAPLLDAAAVAGISVGFVGGTEQTQSQLGEVLTDERPNLRVAGRWAPPREVVTDSVASMMLAHEIRDAGVDILVVGMGKPRQELWIAEYGIHTGAKVLLAFGAVADFLTKRISRAPLWVSEAGLEWSYRLAKEPRRLSRRYLVEGPVAYRRIRRDISLDATERPVNSMPRFSGPDDGADIAVIVVTYNSERVLPTLLSDLRRQLSRLRLRVVVVDNNSTDSTVDVLEQHGDVTLVQPGANLGYAGGVNAARDFLGECRAVLVLNPDVRIQEGALDALWARLWRPRIGVAVPKMLAGDGALFRSIRFEPSLVRTFCDAVLGQHLPSRPGWATETDLNEESYQYPHAVDWATGACLLIRTEVLERVGPWDERFFLYSEETDYLRRVREANWQVWFEPAAVVRHVGGGSGQGPELAALMAVNRVRYAARHHGTGYARAIRALVALGALARSGTSEGSRAAARTLLKPTAWDSLPSANREPGGDSVPRHWETLEAVSATGGAVIVPAHNEEAMIRSTLRPLTDLASSGTIELIVASNGSTDQTVERAREVAGARVLELPAASKPRALNAADASATLWPRLYLDADITITPRAVAAVFQTLERPGVLAARPPVVYDTSGASWAVRAYYRARNRLPITREHLWGAGTYGLNEDGHSRFHDFPDIIADDLYVDSLFSRAEIVVVDTDPVIVRTPRNLGGLMAILRRTYAGNAELAALMDGPTGNGGSSSARTLVDLIRTADTLAATADSVVYAVVVLVGRYRCRDSTVRWERDESSRAPEACHRPQV